MTADTRVYTCQPERYHANAGLLAGFRQPGLRRCAVIGWSGSGINGVADNAFAIKPSFRVSLSKLQNFSVSFYLCENVIDGRILF